MVFLFRNVIQNEALRMLADMAILSLDVLRLQVTALVDLWTMLLKQYAMPLELRFVLHFDHYYLRPPAL